MKKLRLMTIAGTRPELIRLSEIIKKADVYFDHIFVHTGQNYDARLNDIFYESVSVRLKELLDQMRDPAVPFRRTEDEKVCTYCDFKIICGR